MLDADTLSENMASKNGRTWHVARPLPGPFLSRLKDAWAVLTARAEAVRFRE